MVSELPTNQDHTAPLLAMLEFCESQLAYATALAMRIYGLALIAIGTIESTHERQFHRPSGRHGREPRKGARNDRDRVAARTVGAAGED